ncbi:hypothetical protein [uncultured Ruminococcus sp.]|uniref:hypothetical protein n=1 Tax=uncultured Ruminococcus sp. TaxID=165186 RepID=UPI00292E1C8F|nr:hypothetical protein [uncultured Ruminococcus sp.]
MSATFDEIATPLEITVNNANSSPWITFGITLLSGVIVFILGQILFTLWITPLQKYREIKQKIAYHLTYQARYYSDPALKVDKANRDELDKASNELRDIASELQGFIEIMPFIHIGIPSKNDLLETSKNLIGLSNGLFAWRSNKDIQIEQNRKLVNDIRKRIKLQDNNIAK